MVLSPFNTRLRAEVERKQSRLCLGLDLDPTRSSRLHDATLNSLREASLTIVEETWDRVWGYKLNFAFFEQFGAAGYAWLEELAAAIGERAMVIGDAKRGDIGNSARNYARCIFQHLNLDAATVNPYMGQDALEPFLADPARGAFVLCLTTNPGAEDFQRHGNDHPLYLEVAAWARALNDADNLGLVVGATHPDDLAKVRQAAPDLPFLIPGVGAQGGALEPAVACGASECPSIINVSRGIVYAGEGSLDEISAAVEDYNQRINELAQSHGL
ncbi:MAG: orotidine-5'-phosphate decarboxylase [Fidelibacterota bacterium]|nr:MAG: orotidine-5'-phosphate decarboxylase [Candidatus Neomarinimicrobiota bacterium]